MFQLINSLVQAAGGMSRPRHFSGFGKGLSVLQRNIPNLFPHQLD